MNNKGSFVARLVPVFLFFVSCTNPNAAKSENVSQVNSESAEQASNPPDTNIKSSDKWDDDTTASLPGYNIETIFDGMVQIAIPKAMNKMDERTKAFKYPRKNPPQVIFTDEAAAVNIAFRYEAVKAGINSVTDLHEAIDKQLRPLAKEDFRSSMQTISNWDFAVFEFVSQAIDTKVYNKLLATLIDGRMLVCTFNCTTKKLDHWKSLGEKSLESIKIKPAF